MSDQDWVSVGEFENLTSAAVVSKRLNIEGVPHRIVTSPLPYRVPTCWIWVPPEWHDKAKRILAKNAVSDSELTAEALSYPPPDDA
jgi:hypothetical protein